MRQKSVGSAPVMWCCWLVAVSVGNLAVRAQTDDREVGRELAGFEWSEAALIEDGLPFTWSDEVLVRLSHRANRIPAPMMAELANPLTSERLEALISDAAPQRLALFHVIGRVVAIERNPAATGEQSDLPAAFACELRLGPRAARAVVQHVPAALLDGQDIDQPVSLVGFFARLNRDGESIAGDAGPAGGAATAAEPMTPLFIGARLAWHPDRADPTLGVSEGLALLARRGFDAGWVDVIRRYNRRAMNRTEQPAFGAMLQATAAFAQSSDPSSVPANGLGLMDLVREPDRNVGDWVNLEGDVRRVVAWELADESSPGQRRYLQLDLFVPLGDGSVTLRGREGQELVFRGRFPVTCHVPDFLGEGADWTGRRVRVQGFFYRFWSYDSQLAEAHQLDGGQLSPLILGVEVTPIVVDESVIGRWLTWLMLGLLATVVSLVVAYQWWDRRQPLRRRQLPDQIDPATIP